MCMATAALGQNQDKIESFKIAFITQRLNLTAEEAQKFWPIFNDLQANLKSIKQSSKNQKPVADMSDEEASLMNCKLVILLANHIGDRKVLSEAIRLASKKQG